MQQMIFTAPALQVCRHSPKHADHHERERNVRRIDQVPIPAEPTATPNAIC